MADLPLQRTCATFSVHLNMLQSNPAYASARAALLETHAAFAAAGPAALAMTLRSIQTVVHVIHRGGAENITDAQVKSQIDVLNRDFRKKNPDVSKVPAPFKAVVADTMVEFKLATKAPDGSPTTGITRTHTTVASFGADDAMKFAAQGGHDAWDTARYLNIWVCPELMDAGRALLGYAQFPGGPAATDGVAIIHNAFGTTGTAAVPFNLGRTATHEVGHYFDLFHIWGDSPDCLTDDKVADTPMQKTENFGKPVFPHLSCPHNPNGDMFMNYMDYVDDDAMFMFTAGQVLRIRATLAGPRATL